MQSIRAHRQQQFREFEREGGEARRSDKGKEPLVPAASILIKVSAIE